MDGLLDAGAAGAALLLQASPGRGPRPRPGRKTRRAGQEPTGPGWFTYSSSATQRAQARARGVPFFSILRKRVSTRASVGKQAGLLRISWDWKRTNKQYGTHVGEPSRLAQLGCWAVEGVGRLALGGRSRAPEPTGTRLHRTRSPRRRAPPD